MSSLSSLLASSLIRSIDRTSGFHQVQDTTDKLTRTVFPATVIDSIAWMNCYIVSGDRQPFITATALTDTSVSPMGFRWHGMYTPGTHVLCYRLSPERVIIMGAYADDVPWDKTSISDWMLMHSGVGFRDDGVHNYLSTLKDLAGLRNFNHGRPADVMPGETGLINNLGVGLHLGQFSATLRGSGLSAIELFYLDHLVRLNARNFQLWTAAREEFSIDDEGEHNELMRLSSYPWEMLGSKTARVTTARNASGEWAKDQEEAAYEPKHEDQTGIFRLNRFRGFLGDVERDLVVLAGKEFRDTERLSSGAKYVGLSETIKHINGALTFRSMKGIHLQKTFRIPVPRQVREPEDPEGDSRQAKNYKFAGEGSDGAAHNKHEFPVNPKEGPTARLAQLRDMHSWLFNNYPHVSFDRHKKDWSIWEELSPPEDLQGGSDVSEEALFQPLGHKFTHPEPHSIQLEVDHRPGHKHKYYVGTAGVDIQDDGSISITDAWGSAIFMSGGNIYITAQGDIITQAGRSSITLAGRDVVNRAGNCNEMSAALGDLRLKAEKNLHCLAGNSGTGGILLESRSTGFTQDYAKYGDEVVSSGIAMVARNSQVLSYSKQVYVRTLNGGNITLDADRGAGNIDMFYLKKTETAQNGFEIIFGITPDSEIDPTAIEKHDGSQVAFGQSQIITDASVFLMPTDGARIIANGRIYARDGFVHNIVDFPYVFGPWGPEMESYVNSQQSYIDQTLTSPIISQLTSTSVSLYQESSSVGNVDFMRRIGFSHRTDEQYGMEDFIMYETPWQQSFRTAGNGKEWEEPTVIAPDGVGQTLPWPGYANWRINNVFGTVDHLYWDATAGCNKNRSMDIPKSVNIEKTTMENQYLITIQR